MPLSPADPAPPAPSIPSSHGTGQQLPLDALLPLARLSPSCNVASAAAPAGTNRDNTRLLRDEARWAGELGPAAGAIPRQHLSGKINA